MEDSMTQDELSKDDKWRINGCDFYKKTKEVMTAHEKYKEMQIGEVYFIKRTNKHDKTFRYLSRSIGQAPSKYMVFHKDADDFVFIKRINANGKLGKTVECLQTQYSSPYFDVEPDPEYLESIIFEDEGSYDPLKAEKELVKKKGQARRKNKKLEIAFNTPAGAFAMLDSFKVGDKIFDAGTTYGSGIIEWEVTNIIKRKTDKTVQSWGYSSSKIYGDTWEDQQHNKHDLDEFLQIETKRIGAKPKSRRWVNGTDKITFYDFINKQGSTYYSSKPWTTEDV